jgi:hypothetical protein
LNDYLPEANVLPRRTYQSKKIICPLKFWLVNMKTLKVHFKKSHHCHILIGQFLPIAIRGILLVKVRDMIIKLCSFFNAISQKGCGSNEANKTLRWFDSHDVQPRDKFSLPHFLISCPTYLFILCMRWNTRVLCFFIRCIHLKGLWLF